MPTNNREIISGFTEGFVSLWAITLAVAGTSVAPRTAETEAIGLSVEVGFTAGVGVGVCIWVGVGVGVFVGVGVRVGVGVAGGFGVDVGVGVFVGVGDGVGVGNEQLALTAPLVGTQMAHACPSGKRPYENPSPGLFEKSY